MAEYTAEEIARHEAERRARNERVKEAGKRSLWMERAGEVVLREEVNESKTPTSHQAVNVEPRNPEVEKIVKQGLGSVKKPAR